MPRHCLRVALATTIGWWTPISIASAQAPPAPPPPPADGPSSTQDDAKPPSEPASIPSLNDRCDRPNRKAKFQITLKREATVEDLVEWMMSVSCQKFIWAPSLRTKKVNVVAPEPVTMDEAYAAFHAALATIGAAVEPAGDFYRVVESSELPKASFTVYGPGAHVPADDRFVTKVWRPREDQRDLTATLLTELKTEGGVVKSVGDVVVVTDTGHRIRTLERLLGELEQAAGEHAKIHLYGVRHAEADALAEVVRGVFESGITTTTTHSQSPAASPKTKAKSKAKAKAKSKAKSASTVTVSTKDIGPTISVDTRTNTLLVVATDEMYGAIERLLDELDVDSGDGRETLHVLELSHVDAAEVEGVLNNLTGGSKTEPTKGARGQKVGASIDGPVRVTAHVATQSLIVHANAADFAALKRVVERIDRPRRQLYLEVYLLEVRAELNRDLGVGGHVGGAQLGGTGLVNSSQGGSSTAALADSGGGAALLTGLTAGLLGPAIPGSSALLGTSNDVPTFGFLLQAMETQNDIDLVAQPHMYAAENEEAFAEFGETVPVSTGTTLLPNSAVGSINNVSDKEITLKLTVTPYVSDEETVSLDISLEDKQLGQRDNATNNFRTLKRKLDLKKVLAHPEQPLVLGGLTREVEGIDDSRVPGLGSVPVIGWLFRKRTRRKEKVSLLMVIVPHIIESPDDARRIHARRMQERMDFIQRHTAFKRRGLTTHINYRKKSGLLSSLNAASQRQQNDAEYAKQAEVELAREPIRVTLDPTAVNPTP